jgi:integrase
MVDPERLLALGTALMTNAESQLTAQALALALAGPICYRDGLIIGFLALRPIRRRNLAAMRLGQHLVRAGAGWQVIFGADETKTHQPLEFPFPPLLQPFLERYLSNVRPRFPGSEQHDGLWASAKACPLGGDALYRRVSIRTQETFGRPINLHLFRDIAVTAIATKAPEQIGMARDLLGHSTLTTLDRHYNQAQQIEAGRAYQAAVLALREENDHHRPGRTRNRR